jgi:hypothetical protein
MASEDQPCSTWFLIAGLLLLAGCATTTAVVEMAWVRTDGQRIADSPTLLEQGRSDVAACSANLDSGSPSESARGCMSLRGYVLVRRDQAEDIRAAYAAGAQRNPPIR